jgi:NAD(P)-dependent dehydrogenase (short-subunit alcohol dehydrogenase family)
MPDMKSQHEMRDPISQYPKPPFSKQPQSAPGLAAAMDPKPDHGESSYVGSGRLKGRKALITGGDSGIGRATAIAMAREGAAVTINYLAEEQSDVDEVVALIANEGGSVTALPGDISDEAFCGQLVTDAVKAMDGLDILVNVAGRQTATARLADISSEQFDATYKTNVYAMFWIIKAALPHLPKGATIINTTSIQSYQPSPQLVDYASTKAAITAFTKALAAQLAPDGIRVNAVAPGPIWTPLQPSGGQADDKIPVFGEEVPYGRPGQPAEVAPAYVFLASHESSYITGEIIGVTGGNPIH